MEQQPPTNAEVADVFNAIADILDSQGENPFKIRAYRNAVRTLETLPEPVAAIAARGDLKKIPGFGAALVGKTQEILATGTCDLYERLKAGPSAAATPSAPQDDAEESRTAEIVSPW